MYAVLLFVGGQLDKYVRDSWTQLKDLHITSTMPTIDNIRPHITLAAYEELDDEASFGEKLGDYFRDRMNLPITIDSLATFPSTGTIYVSPALTNDLFALHRGYYEHFADNMKSAQLNYLPDRWNPQCTLAIRLTNIQMTRAMACLLNHFKPIQSSIDSIGFVKLHYENGRCVGSSLLNEIVLQQAAIR